MFHWLLKKYKKSIICFCILAILTPIILYLLLLPNTPIPAGSGLRKSDWLAFVGSYLSFIGTVVVAFISAASGSYHNEMENKRRAEERHKEIQPLFSVAIVDVDTLPPGAAEAVNPLAADGMPKHQNVQIKIEIANDHLAKHVIVFDYYLTPLMKSSDRRTICVAYEDSPDIHRWPKEVHTIIKSEFPCDEQGIPKTFNINYEDTDGHQMVQTFKLNHFEDMRYYELVEEPWEV